MPATAPATIDIITSALRKLGVIGNAEPEPSAEDTNIGLDEFNGIVEQLNLRKRNCFFQRTQQFTLPSIKNTYSIGAAGSGADLIVTSGDAPTKIEFARWVLTSASPNPVYIPITVIQIEQDQQLAVPQLQSLWPQLLYYQRTVPNGTVTPYPVPTQISDQLELTWWNQLVTVAIADIATALVLPQGYRRGLALKLAIACWPAFPKRTDLDELKRQDREAWSDIQSPNVAPPKISTTDGIGHGGATFDWRSRQWQ